MTAGGVTYSEDFASNECQIMRLLLPAIKKAGKNPTWAELKQYKYLICPQCAQRLRVPRGKGRIRVTCINCGNVFETRS